jgi:hypothetical protein
MPRSSGRIHSPWIRTRNQFTLIMPLTMLTVHFQDVLQVWFPCIMKAPKNVSPSERKILDISVT